MQRKEWLSLLSHIFYEKISPTIGYSSYRYITLIMSSISAMLQQGYSELFLLQKNIHCNNKLREVILSSESMHSVDVYTTAC